MSSSPIPPNPDHSRRPGVPTRLVVLADGRDWGLAMPESRYRPEPGTVWKEPEGLELPQVALRVGYPWPVERLVERLSVACRVELGLAGDLERFNASIDLAAALLLRAHEMHPDEATALLDLDPAGFSRLVDAVLDAISPLECFSFRGGADA